MRNTSSKNIKPGHPFRFHGWLLAFFVLLFISTFSLENTTFESEKQQVSYSFKANQGNTPNTLVQNSTPVQRPGSLIEFELVEELEPTDDSTEDDAAGGIYPAIIPTPFDSITIQSSFAIFRSALQNRTLIPLFLLHHSWKIPLA